jgi:exosortase A
MVVRPATERTRLARAAALREWLPALAAIGCAAVAFGLVFHAEVTGAVAVWIGSTAYNHCFLVLPLVGFLLWERRATIIAAAPRPVWWPLVLIPPLSAIWLGAAILDILEIRQLAIVAMFEIVLLAGLGTQLFRRLLAPLLFLFFLVPFGAFLVPSLQKVTADFAVTGLHLIGIPVFSNGLIIEIPEGVFEIAEACAGLRFLIASIVFGCFFSVVMYRSWPRRAVFIGLSCIVPIIANGFRALGILVLAHLLGSATAAETDHVLYGWIFFTLVILALIAIGMGFTEESGSPATAVAAPTRAAAPWRIAVAVAAAVLLAGLGPAYAGWLDRNVSHGPLAIADLAAAPPSWHRLTGSVPAWRPEVTGADHESLDTYEAAGGGQVVRYVALYRLRAVGNRLTASDNRIANLKQWVLARRGEIVTTVAGRQVPVTSSLLVGGQRHRLVWSFFVVDGTITDRPFAAKLLQARAALLRRAPLAAFVAVSTSVDDAPDRVEARLRRFLAADPLLGTELAMSSGRR